MSFLLPLAMYILLGYTFDLRNYNFMYGTVYDYNAIKQQTKIKEINDLITEYKLIESEVEYREFLGVDTATNLKALVNKYNYRFVHELKFHMNALRIENVQIALKVSLRTVNETVPFEVPQRCDWESEIGQHIGTHYVKSIIYGADIFLLLSIPTRNEKHKTKIKKSILSTFGRSGTLNASFNEKFHRILRETGSGAYTSSFGTVPYFYDGIPPENINDMLELKLNLADLMKRINDGKGAVLFYEMQPISILSSKVPLIEINSEIVKKLDDVEKKFEDLRIANEQYIEWMNVLGPVSEENNYEIARFCDELIQAKREMEVAISLMDISTLGNIDQFSEAMNSYGKTNDTRKYRRKLDILRHQIL